MSTAAAQGVLQNAGDTLQLILGGVGVGNPPDVAAVFSLTGGFTAAVIAIEAVPLGQPMTPGSPPTVPSEGEWVHIAETYVLNGELQSSPLGPLTSTGAAGSGFAFTAGIAAYSALRIRLVSTGGGAIQGGIATLPFPTSTGVIQAIAGAVNVKGGPVTTEPGVQLVPGYTPPNEAAGAEPVDGTFAPLPGDRFDGANVNDEVSRRLLLSIHKQVREMKFAILVQFKNPHLEVFNVLHEARDLAAMEDDAEEVLADNSTELGGG